MTREEELLAAIKELLHTFEQTARQTLSKLEQKSEQLRQLISEADAQIAELRRIQAQPGARSDALHANSTVSDADPKAKAPIPFQPAPTSARSAEVSASKHDSARKLDAPALSLGKPLPERVGREERAQILGRAFTPPPEKVGLDPSLFTDKHKRVYQLADDGLSVDEIAAIAKIGKGEVMLILSLRERHP